MSNDPVLLEGFHAVKHALRFGAEIDRIVALPTSSWRQLAAELAPDVHAEIERRVEIVDDGTFRLISPGRHPTGIAARAKRPKYPKDILSRDRTAPAVLLEDPHRLGNVGATIRVAAAAGASAVFTTGPLDPWLPEAIRGSAGLHFALPVMQLTSILDLPGPLIALDPTGRSIREHTIPPQAVLCFGTEREGLTQELLDRADQTIALPMRDGVSSLNLATSVAATLYLITS